MILELNHSPNDKIYFATSAGIEDPEETLQAIQEGADPNYVRGYGEDAERTPIVGAAYALVEAGKYQEFHEVRQWQEVITELLKAGADPKRRDDDGVSAESYAASTQNSFLIEALGTKPESIESLNVEQEIEQGLPGLEN